MKIFAGRASLVGDQIMALPMLDCLHKMYDNPEISWALAPKCSQAGPLYLFNDKIHSIVLTKDNERLIEREELEENYDLVLDVFPPHRKEQDWYNHRSCVEETMLMAAPEIWNVWKTLPKDLQQPRLNPWWLQDKPEYFKDRKYIAIFPFAGYSKGLNRSPSKEWWIKLMKILANDFNCKIYHFGHFNEPYMSWQESWEQEDSEFCYYESKKHLPFFTQIQLANECDLVIGTDSGSSWIMGALGANQINLITQWENGHNNNSLALSPENWADKNTVCFARDGCDNIDINNVVMAAYEKLK